MLIMPKKQKETIFEKPKQDDEEMVGEQEGFREHEEHPDEIEHTMRVGGAEVDVYTEEGREELKDDDEVADWEEGFSKGEDDPELAHCAHCGKVLGQDQSSVIERESDHVTYLFCSAACADKGVKHGKKR